MATCSYFGRCPVCEGDNLNVCEDTKLGAIHPGVTKPFAHPLCHQLGRTTNEA